MDIKPLPFRSGLDRYQKQAEALVDAVRAQDPKAFGHVRRFHPRLPGRVNTNDRNKITRQDIERVQVFLDDAQDVVAGWYGFKNWTALAEHVAALRNKDARVLEFEMAVEAIIAGDEGTLRSLLKREPELSKARSTRHHRATLLHYVAANGVEGYRQRTPKNAVRIARMLLKAGAEVDADLDYGQDGTKRYPERSGSTTLGMAATSFHPAAAGVQIALLRTLLKAGASVNGLKGGWNPLIASLHNGRGDAARYLGRQGARLDLEGAAGIGRLDVVKKFFTRDGCLKPKATRHQMEAGFMWACEYGRWNVVSFLLKNGIDITAQPHGETGLHWASYGGYPGIVEAILRRGGNVDLRDKRFGATPLSWVLHGWCFPPPEARARARRVGYYRVAALLVSAGAKLHDVRLDAEMNRKFRKDRKMRMALGLDKSPKSGVRR